MSLIETIIREWKYRPHGYAKKLVSNNLRYFGLFKTEKSIRF